MRRFRVGDKVRVVKKSTEGRSSYGGGHHYVNIGHIFIIGQTRNDVAWGTESPLNGCGFWFEELELCIDNFEL